MSEATSRRPLWLAGLRWGLASVLLAVVFAQLWPQWQLFQVQELTLAWGWGLLALAGIGCFMGLGCEAWRRILIGLGAPISYRAAFRILFLSNMVKYLPGGAWNLVGRVALCERAGLPPLKVTISLLMEMACQVTACLIIGLLALPALHGPVIFAHPLWILGVAALIATGLHPAVINTGLHVLEVLLRRTLFRVTLSYPFVLAMLGFYLMNWLLLDFSILSLAQAVRQAPFTFGEAAQLMGGFSIAWNAGTFAFFLPAGLGAREAAMVGLLGSAFPGAWLAMLALLARVWIVVVELLAFLLALLLKPEQPALLKPEQQPDPGRVTPASGTRSPG